MAKFITLLINLDGSDDRLVAAKAALDAAGIDFERFPAFDARGKAPTDFPFYDNRAAIGFFSRPMTGGEIGCYMSHLQCAQRLLDSDADYALVLEDDMTMPSNGGAVVADLIDHLDAVDPDWEIVNLGRPAHKIATDTGTVHGLTVQAAHYFPVTTTGLLWSRKGAAAFAATEGHVYGPVDHFFRRFFTKRGHGFALSPALTLPSGAQSEIDVPAAQTRDRPVRGLRYHWIEFRRQAQNYFYAYTNRAAFKKNQ